MSFPPQPSRFPDDNLNPYASPRGEIGAMPYEPAGASDIPPTIEGVLGHAWAIFKERWGICLGATLLFFAIVWGYQIASSLVPTILNGGQPPQQGTMSLVPIVLALVGYALQFWLTAGFTLVMLRIARGAPAAIGDVFAGGPYFWRILGANLLVGLAVGGLMMVLLVPLMLGMFSLGGNQGGAWPLLLLVLVVPLALVLVFFGIRLSQFNYLIVDRDMGAIEALRQSMELTRGRSGLVLGVGLVAGLINLGGLLAIGLGLLVTGPFTVLTCAVLFLALGGGPSNPGAAGHAKPLSEPDFL